MIQSRQSNNNCHTLKTWQTVNPQDMGPQQSKAGALSLEDYWRTTGIHSTLAACRSWVLMSVEDGSRSSIINSSDELTSGEVKANWQKAKFLSPTCFCLCSLGFYFNSYLWFSALCSCPIFPQWWNITRNFKIKRTFSFHAPICSMFFHNNRQSN